MTPDVTSSHSVEAKTKEEGTMKITSTPKKKSATKETTTSPEAALVKELKLLIQKGIDLETQLMENPEMYDSDSFDDMVEEWEDMIKLFRNMNSSSLTKPQERILKLLKKKAEYLND